MSTPVKKPAVQSGAELLVKSLEAQGVEYVFGIPGAKELAMQGPVIIGIPADYSDNHRLMETVHLEALD